MNIKLKLGVWIAVKDQLPKPGTPVLVSCEKLVLRAAHAPRFTLLTGLDDNFPDGGDYNEEADDYYWPEGWYEWNQYEDTHWRLWDAPEFWMPLPDAPKAKKEQQHETRS